MYREHDDPASTLRWLIHVADLQRKQTTWYNSVWVLLGLMITVPALALVLGLWVHTLLSVLGLYAALFFSWYYNSKSVCTGLLIALLVAAFNLSVIQLNASASYSCGLTAYIIYMYYGGSKQFGLEHQLTLS